MQQATQQITLPATAADYDFLELVAFIRQIREHGDSSTAWAVYRPFFQRPELWPLESDQRAFFALLNRHREAIDAWTAKHDEDVQLLLRAHALARQEQAERRKAMEADDIARRAAARMILRAARKAVYANAAAVLGDPDAEPGGLDASEDHIAALLELARIIVVLPNRRNPDASPHEDGHCALCGEPYGFCEGHRIHP